MDKMMKGTYEIYMFVKIHPVACVAATILISAMSLTGCSGDSGKNINTSPNEESSFSDTHDSSDINTDIDLDALNKSVKSIQDLKFDTDVNSDSQSNETAVDTEQTDNTSEISATEPAGDKTVYSFTDVYRDGNDLTIIPNGGLNASTILYAGKDIKGFLDYIDSVVLEEGRTINRDFFYDMLAVMLVDKDLSSDPQNIENNLIMSLAMANNFHDTDIKINDCYLDANNAAEYDYHLTIYGKDDTWLVNYRDRTVYMNNGKTEYVSDMFKDEYLAVWMVAIEDYYGIKFQ